MPMSRVAARGAVAAIAAALMLGMMPTAQSVAPLPTDPDRRCAWPVVYPGEANYAWPDTNAAYINQAALIGKGEKVVISGRDPKARFWSITTYNLEDREVIDRVNDVNVRRKSGAWSVTVSHRDIPGNPNSLKAAPLPGPGEQTTFRNVTVIMFRVYLSETGNYAGGKRPLVTLHHSDGTTETLKPCRPDQVGAPDNPLGLVPAEGVPSHFIRAEGGKFYPSHDTSYLAAQVPYDPDRILLVTGKAPRVPRDVRYWSVCQNINGGDLPVIDCASDRDVTLTDGRFAIAVVGPGQVPDRSLYPRVTFVEWAKGVSAEGLLDAFLIWRNVLPAKAFPYSVDKVPFDQPATSTMGEYAPVISHVTLEELGQY